jgi:hypothetical protein
MLCDGHADAIDDRFMYLSPVLPDKQSSPAFKA